MFDNWLKPHICVMFTFKNYNYVLCRIFNLKEWKNPRSWKNALQEAIFVQGCKWYVEAQTICLHAKTRNHKQKIQPVFLFIIYLNSRIFFSFLWNHFLKSTINAPSYFSKNGRNFPECYSSDPKSNKESSTNSKCEYNIEYLPMN